MTKRLWTRGALLEFLVNETAWWATYLGVSHVWHIRVKLLDGKELKGSRAETSWPAFYRDADIKYNWDNVQYETQDEIRNLVVHEVFHLVTADLRDAMLSELGDGRVYKTLVDQEEKLVDMLSRILLRSIEQGMTLDEIEMVGGGVPEGWPVPEEPELIHDAGLP